MSTRYTLSVLVEDKLGVFTRIAALFARRAFNIHSLAVGETEDPRISRMTVAIDAAESPIEQVIKRLSKLINVLKIVEPDPAMAVECQSLLVKVPANDPSWANVLRTADLFRARVVNVVPSAVVVETTGSDAKVEAFLTTLEPCGIWGVVQSGMAVIIRGARLLSERVATELN